MGRRAGLHPRRTRRTVRLTSASAASGVHGFQHEAQCIGAKQRYVGRCEENAIITLIDSFKPQPYRIKHFADRKLRVKYAPRIIRAKLRCAAAEPEYFCRDTDNALRPAGGIRGGQAAHAAMDYGFDADLQKPASQQVRYGAFCLV